MQLEQDPIHQHKDVLAHTIAVVRNTEHTNLRVRLAALLHDIGKPKTRSIGPGGVSFHHHEVVGARMAEERLRALRYPNDVVEDVSRLVYLHLRIHTYSMGWTDRAVRRYVRDAGPLLDDLNHLVRCDCTTRNQARARALNRRMDELEARIAALREQEELDRIRPPLDGRQVMDVPRRPAGPVGRRGARLPARGPARRGPDRGGRRLRAAAGLGAQPGDRRRLGSEADIGGGVSPPPDCQLRAGAASEASATGRAGALHPFLPGAPDDHLGDVALLGLGLDDHLDPEAGAAQGGEDLGDRALVHDDRLALALRHDRVLAEVALDDHGWGDAVGLVGGSRPTQRAKGCS